VSALLPGAAAADAEAEAEAAARRVSTALVDGWAEQVGRVQEDSRNFLSIFSVCLASRWRSG
jgi:hypothetical protein